MVSSGGPPERAGIAYDLERRVPTYMHARRSRRCSVWRTSPLGTSFAWLVYLNCDCKGPLTEISVGFGGVTSGARITWLTKSHVSLIELLLMLMRIICYCDSQTQGKSRDNRPNWILCCLYQCLRWCQLVFRGSIRLFHVTCLYNPTVCRQSARLLWK